MAHGVVARGVVASLIGHADWTRYTSMTGHMLIGIADHSIATGVAARRVMRPSQVSLTTWAGCTDVADHALIRAAERGIAGCFVSRGCNDVFFSSWALNAYVTERRIIHVAKYSIACGINIRGIINVPVGLASRTSQACMTPHLLIRAAVSNVAAGVAT
jgi:hypothetical protein